MTTFHSGDLSSGISFAIQQSKSVACFILSPSDSLSETWEHEWLNLNVPEDLGPQERTVGDSLAEKAVLLKIEYGSQEAGFLGAFCEVKEAPMVVVIRNGQVLEKIGREVEWEEWARRLAAVGGDARRGGEEREGEVADESQSNQMTEQHTSHEISEPTQPPSAPSVSTSTAPSAPPQPDLSTLFPIRSTQHASASAAASQAEATARAARSAARKKEAEEAHAQHKATGKGKDSQARDAWLSEQKRRKDESRLERERILARIAADREERKLRSRPAQSQEEGESTPLPPSRLASARRTAGGAGTCHLQLRLFDGTSIRASFPSATATLAKDVREHVASHLSSEAKAEARETEIPYTFRALLPPAPARTVSDVEEHSTLAELGLAPSATLVLVPVAGSYTNSYPSTSTASGLVGGVMGYGYSALETALKGLSYFLPSFRATGEETTTADAGSGSVEAKAFETRRGDGKGRQTEFYNGNSSAFEARKGEADEDGENSKGR